MSTSNNKRPYFLRQMADHLCGADRNSKAAKMHLRDSGGKSDLAVAAMLPEQRDFLKTESTAIIEKLISFNTSQLEDLQLDESLNGLFARRGDTTQQLLIKTRSVLLSFDAADDASEVTAEALEDLTFEEARAGTNPSPGAQQLIVSLRADLVVNQVAAATRTEMRAILKAIEARLGDLFLSANEEILVFGQVKKAVTRAAVSAKAEATYSVEPMTEDAETDALIRRAIETDILPKLVRPIGEIAECQAEVLVAEAIARLDRYVEIPATLSGTIDAAVLTSRLNAFDPRAGIATYRAPILGLQPPIVVVKAPVDVAVPRSLGDAVVQRLESDSPDSFSVTSFAFGPLSSLDIFDATTANPTDADFLAHAPSENIAVLREIFALECARLSPADKPGNQVDDENRTSYGDAGADQQHPWFNSHNFSATLNSAANGAPSQPDLAGASSDNSRDSRFNGAAH